MRRLFIFALIVSCQLLAQDLTNEIRADVDRRVNFQRNWGPRMNSPGAKLEPSVVANAPKNNHVFMYELRATGLPTDREYEFFSLPMMGSSYPEMQSLGNVTVDKKDGKVMNRPGDPRRIIIPHATPGEPYRFALISKDGEDKAFVTVLPNAIESHDKGCGVSVIRMFPKFELALVQFTGLTPKSETMFHGNSEGELRELTLKTDEEGYADITVLPSKKGMDKGSMEVGITSSMCNPKVKFRWGSTD